MGIIQDFYRYMDTTTPKGVDHDKYIELKYTNEERINEFLEEYNIIDRILLEKVAIREFMKNDDNKILSLLEQYYVGQKTTQKNNKTNEL